MTANEDPTGAGSIQVGDVVHDIEDDTPNDAIVVRLPDGQSDEIEVGETGDTVADFNPDYPADAPTAVVAFEAELDDADSGWEVSTPESLLELVREADIQTYTYPVPRLDKQDSTRISPRRTDDGNRYIHRLLVTGVGDKLVYGEDYDGVDHQHGRSRNICFHKQDWDVEEENLIRVEYAREKTDIERLPPMLVDIKRLEILEATASPDFLLDL